MNKPAFSRALGCLVAACVIAPWAHGNSATMTYQGVVLDSSGDPIPNGVYPITVNIWDTAIGGAVPLWTESHANVQVSGGVFAILLGLITPFDTLFADNTELFVEVLANLGGGTQLFTPRVPISAAPYAFDSMTVQGLDADELSQFVEDNVRAGFMGTGNGSTVSGGISNAASGSQATVSGGFFNVASGNVSTVGGGINNEAQAELTTIAGGGGPLVPDNANRAYDAGGSIGGGSRNRTGTDNGDAFDAPSSTVSSGLGNVASGRFAVIGGGSDNTASGSESTVAGGEDNVASGFSAAVPGGSGNTASGGFSFAAGRNSNAIGTGSFCFGDGTTSQKFAGTAHSFACEFSGGYTFFTNSAASAGVFMGTGANAWSSVSDRKAKTDFEPIDAVDMLEKVAAMPIEAWTYKSQPGIRHIGPVAQDFYEAFGLGASDERIATIDADGIALAAIQGLHAENVALKARIAQLETLMEKFVPDNEGR